MPRRPSTVLASTRDCWTPGMRNSPRRTLWRRLPPSRLEVAVAAVLTSTTPGSSPDYSKKCSTRGCLSKFVYPRCRRISLFIWCLSMMSISPFVTDYCAWNLGGGEVVFNRNTMKALEVDKYSSGRPELLHDVRGSQLPPRGCSIDMDWVLVRRCFRLLLYDGWWLKVQLTVPIIYNFVKFQRMCASSFGSGVP